MYPVGGLLVWRVDETECRPALGVVPICEELHTVFVLNLQVLDVEPCYVLGGYFGRIMTVEEDRHQMSPESSARSSTEIARSSVRCHQGRGLRTRAETAWLGVFISTRMPWMILVEAWLAGAAAAASSTGSRLAGSRACAIVRHASSLPDTALTSAATNIPEILSTGDLPAVACGRRRRVRATHHTIGSLAVIVAGDRSL